MGIETTNDEGSASEIIAEPEGSVSQDEIDAMMESGGSVSQDEIDAMMGFNGTSGAAHSQEETASRVSEQEFEAVSPPPGKSERSEVVSLDLLNQDRITRSRMPTMEVLNDRFARSFRVSLFNYLRRC